MVNDYVPTTGEVREAVRRGYLHPSDLDLDDVPGLCFDRWLAAHEAKVKAEALREAVRLMEELRQAIGFETPAVAVDCMKAVATNYALRIEGRP